MGRRKSTLRNEVIDEDGLATEKTPLMDPVSVSGPPSPPPELPEIDSDQPISAEVFSSVIEEVRYAISKGVQPTMISQGSSGSYFCRDRGGKILGVFKPKSEEPYGKLNPKWSKWLQRTCCPCCFGRGCLIPNSGYISEASASLVDQMLGLDVVPRTEIVSLASPSFYYKYFDKRRHPLPQKVGSFQVFVRGYKDATICIKEFQAVPLPENLKRQFRLQFERLVILDYITRNTDRGNDNWLIKIDTAKETPSQPKAPKASPRDGEASSSAQAGDPETSRENAGEGVDASPSLDDEWEKVPDLFLKIAAIDNGLSFPFKHPDSWRAYPFGWAFLSAAQVPFSQETKDLFLPKLIDPEWCEHLVSELRKIAQVDSDFNEKQFGRQMAVIRGQIFNLIQALMKLESPYALTQMPPLRISHVDSNSGVRRRLMSMRAAAPFFSTW